MRKEKPNHTQYLSSYSENHPSIFQVIRSYDLRFKSKNFKKAAEFKKRKYEIYIQNWKKETQEFGGSVGRLDRELVRESWWKR